MEIGLISGCTGVSSVWVMWLSRGWPERSGVILDVFLAHCVLCCEGGSLHAGRN